MFESAPFHDSFDMVSRRDDLTDEPIVEGLFSRHPIVSLGVLRDPLQALARGLGEHLIDTVARLDDLLRCDLEIAGLADNAGNFDWPKEIYLVSPFIEGGRLPPPCFVIQNMSIVLCLGAALG